MFIFNCVYFNTSQHVAYLKCFAFSWGSKTWRCHQGICDCDIGPHKSNCLDFVDIWKQKNPLTSTYHFSLISSADTCAFFTEQAWKPSVSQKQCNLSYYQKLNWKTRHLKTHVKKTEWIDPPGSKMKCHNNAWAPWQAHLLWLWYMLQFSLLLWWFPVVVCEWLH